MPNVTNYHPKRNDTDWQDEAKKLLSKFNCKVVFHKANGEIREMVCTLKSNVIPQVENKEPVTHKNLVVFDTEKNGWRSIVFDRIISFKVI